MPSLMIDDAREMSMFKKTPPEKGDMTVRTYTEGIKMLKRYKWDMLYLDYDLADFDGAKEWTGYDVAVWLEHHPIHLPKEVLVVSRNNIGAQRILVTLQKLYKRIHNDNSIVQKVYQKDET